MHFTCYVGSFVNISESFGILKTKFLVKRVSRSLFTEKKFQIKKNKNIKILILLKHLVWDKNN
jgi:hypothetical protein